MDLQTLWHYSLKKTEISDLGFSSGQVLSKTKSPFFYISYITKSLSFNGKICRKKSMLGGSRRLQEAINSTENVNNNNSNNNNNNSNYGCSIGQKKINFIIPFKVLTFYHCSINNRMLTDPHPIRSMSYGCRGVIFLKHSI